MALKIIDLGLVSFPEAYALQRELFQEVKSGVLDKVLVICRHYPVITCGRSAKKSNITVSVEELKNKGITIYDVERGGDVTYHGPGQLTVYPVFNLNYLKKDINWFLRFLEGLIISALSECGIKGKRRLGLTGVWVGERKIASIGIAVRNWITFHGLSINIKRDDLANFSLIRPCGMDIMITSVESELGNNICAEDFKKKFINTLESSIGSDHAVKVG
ncbi:MAG: lipoyl(octanoyl) transferase LipB [Candidatus Omnitrophica bacterium]|nr:lipoyl(octanoyl) transferase LipB [Candidatus Omnitrophota bacterium]